MKQFKNWPTPINSLKFNDGQNSFYIKRDDLLPLYLGGNKVRIAQKYYADMKALGCDCIIAYGNSRSNLCRVLANMCKAGGVPCLVISPADESGERARTINSIITKAMGAQIIPCLKTEAAPTVARVLDKCRGQGLNPYYIYGNIYGKGNEKVAVQAYFEVYEEIKAQEKELGIHFDYIFLACGTGTTMAGLICGKLNRGDEIKIVGISAAREKRYAASIVKENIDSYFAEGPPVNNEADVTIVDDYLAGGYGCYNDEIIKVINETLAYDGIALDTTYTGKAFWGMQQYVIKEQICGKNILFIHTGGISLFFDKTMEIFN